LKNNDVKFNPDPTLKDGELGLFWRASPTRTIHHNKRTINHSKKTKMTSDRPIGSVCHTANKSKLQLLN